MFLKIVPTPDFFTECGLLAVRDFFDRQFCAQICAEMKEAAQQGLPLQGAVWSQGGDKTHLNEEVRRTKMFIFSTQTNEKVRAKLIELMPQAAKHFSVELTDCQDIKFAIYEAGDFFKPHVDVTGEANAPAEIKERKVAVVIFLNEETTEAVEGGYSGGRLTFYGLPSNPVFAQFGLPLSGERGLLIAFPPTILHEVTPVTSGERFVIITWYK